MAKFVLDLHKEGSSISTFPVGTDGLVIGRASECDIVLPDSMVSRRHARVWLEGESLKVEDLGSRNGIIVNGERVVRLKVDEGDEVTVGTHTFRIVKSRVDKVLSDTGSMISYERAEDMYEKMVQEGDAETMPILYQAAQLLGTVFDLDELLDKILELIFEAIPVKRGYILIAASDGKAPTIRAGRPKDKKNGYPTLSQTLVEQVFTSKSALLTVNAQQDFSYSESVIDQKIQAVMCVPLCGRTAELVGAIYVDSGESERIFKISQLKLLTAIGRVTGVAVENARLHQEAVERERLAAIGKATAGLGHCVKNILTGIKGGSEYIELGVDEEAWKYVKKGWPLVRRSIDRIEDLVINLMTYSRDREPERMSTDINSIISEILAVTTDNAKKSKVDIVFQPGEIGTAHLDGLGIYRALLNLIQNAIEACEEHGGTVTIRTRTDEGAIYVEVQDTGVGIKEEFYSELFKAFSSTKGSRGTGLGLVCSQKIIEEHGGVIRVKSKEGQGSTFTVFLPRSTTLQK
ncbi:MAG: hypothetical protein AMXMBFR84_34230 [Candidatus Hydrogenedentota bacterium]